MLELWSILGCGRSCDQAMEPVYRVAYLFWTGFWACTGVIGAIRFVGGQAEDAPLDFGDFDRILSRDAEHNDWNALFPRVNFLTL